MSDDDIKPVAVLCETEFGRYWSANIAVKCLPLGDYYHQSAIDRLTAELVAVARDYQVARAYGDEQYLRSTDRLDRVRELEGQLAQLTAERDEAQRKLSVAVAEGKALVADAERYRKIEALAAGTPEQWWPVEDAAFAAHWGNAQNFSLNIDAINAARTKNKEQTNG